MYSINELEKEKIKLQIEDSDYDTSQVSLYSYGSPIQQFIENNTKKDNFETFLFTSILMSLVYIFIFHDLIYRQDLYLSKLFAKLVLVYITILSVIYLTWLFIRNREGFIISDDYIMKIRQPTFSNPGDIADTIEIDNISNIEHNSDKVKIISADKELEIPSSLLLEIQNKCMLTSS